MQFLSTSRISVYALSILPCIFQISISSHVERRDSLLSSLPLGDSALVVLPLGDSITFGTDSTDGNGYRLDLENLLEPANNLQYIGSVQAGTMADNFNEGHPGFTITQIQAEAAQDFAKEPNVVLLMAGTNDVLQNLSVSDAPSRLGDLIDLLTSNLNNSAILVATLTPLFNATDEAERVTYNAAIPGLIETRVQAGKRVMMVDMGNVTTAEISTSDGIHPDDLGYRTMAEAWYDGIITASAKGLITGTSVNGTLGNFSALANITITASKTLSASTSSTGGSSTATAKSFAVDLLRPSLMFSALTTLILGFIMILGF